MAKKQAAPAAGPETSTENLAEAQPAPQEAQAQEHKTVTKTKKLDTPNLIAEVAIEMENITKPKALKLAESLYNEVEVNYFRLGGVLWVIQKEEWFVGYDDFATFVREKFGFEDRKARYLIDIYVNLVEKQIPWEKVQVLGWTKLKDLVRREDFTVDTIDEWVAKVGALSYKEMMKLLAGDANGGEGGTTKTSSDVTTFKFQVKGPQAVTIQSALAKARAEAATDYDNVAFEAICVGYLSDASPTGQVQLVGDALVSALQKVGLQAVIEAVNNAFPTVNLALDEKVPAVTETAEEVS